MTTLHTSPRHRTSLPHPQRGLSLLELLIAMTLGLLILGGVLFVYSSSSQSYRVADNTSRLQENARIAFQILAQDIRMAGYMGCFGSVPNVATQATPSPPFDINTVVVGENGTNFTDGLSGTDAITIRRASTNSVFLKGNMASDNANIQVSSNPYGFKAEDILFISDCTSADIFCATGVSSAASTVTITHAIAGSGTCGNKIPPKLSKIYGPDAQVMAFVQNTYYIRPNPAGEPALYRIPWNGDALGSAEELVEGIYDMQITYGVDTVATDNATAATAYQDHATVTAGNNWPNVLSVRVTLSLRTLDDGVSTVSQTYTLDGVSVTDRRVRRNFNSTIAVRNRLP